MNKVITREHKATRKTKFILYASFILAVFFVASAFGESLNCPCRVVNIISGDTVFVLDQYRSSRKIWLAGVDAPAMNERVGMQSRMNLVDLVGNQQVDVSFIKRDRYGRIAGKLIKDGEDMNLRQIEDGHARYYKLERDKLSGPDQALYQLAEARAKQQEVGLWAQPITYP